MKVKMFVCLCICAALGSLASAQVLGKIDYMEGKVDITRNGSPLGKVAIGTSIENLDLIKTSGDGTVTITFTQASGLTGTLQIVPSTSAVIRQDQLSGAPSNEVHLMTGSVNLKVKKLVGMKSAIQVKTPTSVAGVRGTEFVVASYNGSVLVACKEGEVACSSWSEASGSQPAKGKSLSSVPGTLVEVLESGSLKSGKFPAGNFEKNWKDIQSKWKSFNVNIVSEDPLSWMNLFVNNWDLYSAKLAGDYSTLRSNEVLTSWLSTAQPVGDYAAWLKEKPAVMQDLIAVRPDIVLGMISWYRLQEVIPCISDADMSLVLANGKTVREFIKQYNSAEKTVASAIALFNAAEKQYMLRNDGASPFTDF